MKTKSGGNILIEMFRSVRLNNDEEHSSHVYLLSLSAQRFV